MRFSVKTRAVKRFVSQFVHVGVTVGSDEHERHQHFLTFSGLASSCLLALVPLVVAGNQTQPGIWAAIAAVAALPFFLGVLVSRTGWLDAALNILTLSVASGFGFAIAMMIFLLIQSHYSILRALRYAFYSLPRFSAR